MDESRDPVESAADGRLDLYDIADWEERTSVDGAAVALHWLLIRAAKWIVVAVAFSILAGIGGLAALSDPAIGLLTVLSVVPAAGLAAYVYYSDVTSGEPLSLLVTTFLLAILLATFAALINSGAQQRFFEPLGAIGLPLFYFLIVGPTEETVKLLAVRLYAYTDRRFDAVVDGAVYGAVAGLGFATIENAIYILQRLEESGTLAELSFGITAITTGGDITAFRALAGPGHVIYSATAGYYLGLAKFNPDNRGPIVLKGLLIATFIHATYNTTVGPGSFLLSRLTGLPDIGGFLVYVLLFDGVFGFYLLRKIWRYRRAYNETNVTNA
jgi:RsiW-degrading membrane proteinase PrsW (M82 family)